MRVGLVARAEATMPWELVNSVMMSPQPPWLRMRRRKTVSVTPAMGASTVAGAIFIGPIWNAPGTTLTILTPVPVIRFAELQARESRIDIAQQARQYAAGAYFDEACDATGSQGAD